MTRAAAAIQVIRQSNAMRSTAEPSTQVPPPHGLHRQVILLQRTPLRMSPPVHLAPIQSSLANLRLYQRSPYTFLTLMSLTGWRTPSGLAYHPPSLTR